MSVLSSDPLRALLRALVLSSLSLLLHQATFECTALMVDVLAGRTAVRRRAAKSIWGKLAVATLDVSAGLREVLVSKQCDELVRGRKTLRSRRSLTTFGCCLAAAMLRGVVKGFSSVRRQALLGSRPRSRKRRVRWAKPCSAARYRGRLAVAAYEPRVRSACEEELDGRLVVALQGHVQRARAAAVPATTQLADQAVVQELPQDGG